MPDFIYELKDKLLEFTDSIKSLIPYEFYERLPVIVPGIIAAASLAALFICARAGSGANSIEEKVIGYQSGQEQLASVLGTEEDIGLSDEAECIMGRTDLILQYKDLSSLEGQSAFTSMEKMANVSESAEAKALENADSAYYESIISFAGEYGGALIRNPDETGKDIKLASYVSETDMTAPEDDAISNVLVKQIKRTIPSRKYGESDTRNTLTVLSGNDIRRFSSIKKGSVMYLLVGKSSGNKSTEKYICTGIEPGSMEENSAEDSDDERDDVRTEETETQSGVSGHPEASIDVSAGADEEISVDSNGTVTYGDGTKVKKDGTVIYPDGTTVAADGTVTYTDGMIITPDGTIKGGNTGSSKNSSSSSRQTSQNVSEKDKQKDSQTDTEKKDNSVSGGQLADTKIPTVYEAGGINVEDDEENTVILYSVNTKTGSVTITYWNPEESFDTDTDDGTINAGAEE